MFVYRIIRKSVKIFLLLFFFLWVVLIGYISFSEKSMFILKANLILPLMEKIFANNLPYMSEIKIEDGFFTWDKLNSKFRLVLVNSAGRLKGSNFLVKSPKIEILELGFQDFFESITEYLFDYLAGSNSPVIFRLDELTIYEGKSLNKAESSFNFEIFPKIYSAFSLLNAAKLSLDNVYYETYRNNEKRELGSFELIMDRRYDIDILNIKLGNKENGFVIAEFSESYRSVLSSKVSFENFNLSFLDTIDSPIQVTDLGLVNGYILSKSKRKKNLLSFDVFLKSNGFKFACNSADLCNVDSIQTELSYDNGDVFSGDTYLSIDGYKVGLEGKLLSNDLSLILKIPPVDDKSVCKYWLYQGSARDWFCKNVSTGQFSNLEINFLFSSKNSSGNSEVQISGGSDFSGAEIEFGDQKFRKIIDGSGSVKFNEQGADIVVTGGKIRDVNVVNGKVSVSDEQEYIGLNIDAKVQGGLKEAYNIADLNPADIGVTDKSVFNGVMNASVKLEMNFPYADGKPNTVVNLQVNGSSHGALIKGIGYSGFVVEKCDVNLLINNDDFAFDVKNDAYNISIYGQYSDPFVVNGVIDAVLLPVNVAQLKILPLDSISGGSLPVHAVFLATKEKFEAMVNANIKDLAFVVPIAGWENKEKYETLLKMHIISGPKRVLFIDDLTVSGEGVAIKGRGAIDSNGYMFYIPDAKVLTNEFSFVMRNSNKKVFYDINAKFLNLSNINFISVDESDDVKEKFISVKVDDVLLKNGVKMNKLNILLDCVYDKCSNSYIRGSFNEKENTYVDVDFSEVGVYAFSNNAGSLFRGLGIIKDIYMGDFHLFMTNLINKRSEGIMSLTDFRVVGAPILGTVLSMSSLDSVTGNLNGEGIPFTNVTVPFTYVAPVLKVDESWIEGAALGASISGVVDVKHKKYILGGEIVPAYAFNKFIWSIPLVGKLLTGGKSRGIISLDYGLAGDAEDYKLSVNIMSVLTPSLLKEFLSVFNKVLSEDRRIEEYPIVIE